MTDTANRSIETTYEGPEMAELRRALKGAREENRALRRKVKAVREVWKKAAPYLPAATAWEMEKVMRGTG